MPKVTVVTITFNLIKAGREKTFLQCVESVKNQTYPNIEHIIIDGASTDGTLDLIKSTGLQYYSEPDDGIYYAMNKGIEKGTGKYVAFLNSDDFWHDERGVEESIRLLEEENADFSYAVCRYLDDEDEIMGNLMPVVGSFFIRMPFSHQTMFTKREKMLELGSFDTTFASAGDFDFVMRLILNGAKGVSVPLNFTTFRLGGVSHLQAERSDRECVEILYKNLHTFGDITIENCRKMYFNNCILKDLFDKILGIVDTPTRSEMGQIINSKPNSKGYCTMKKIPEVARETYLKLFGVRVIKIIKYWNIAKYLLFNKILILKSKDKCVKMKYYLFGFIPILTLKKTDSKI